jgi:hypothetical protein
MKVYISAYRNHWLSPYTILEKVFFWREIVYSEPIIDKLSDMLNPVCKGIQKILDIVHPEIRYVKIDRYDTWNMDGTLAHIILPMLKQLKKDKHGAPFTDDEDVPESLRSTSAPPKKNEWDTDDNHQKRWDWILDEMIQAFECKVDDSWEDQYRKGEHDMKSVPCDWDADGKPTLYTFEDGPNHTYECDYKALGEHMKRNRNGYRLFGKYYEGLWD